MKAFNSLVFLVCALVAACDGFQVAHTSSFTVIRSTSAKPFVSSAVRPLKQSNNNPNDDEEQRVRVDLVEDVDSFSLTAIGFGLIAFNFLVLANLVSLSLF